MKNHFTAASFLLLSLIFSVSVFAQRKVTFPSKDGLMVTADVYQKSPDLPVIVLCHQARFSRGEYKDIAKQLNELGFNCIAIDQRSGARIFGIVNETNQRALEGKLNTEYLDAEPDILAAIEFAYKKYKRKVILWGSSYSASLALKIANENEKVNAVLAFSPGEYFGDQLILHTVLKGLNKPVFATSALDEANDVTLILSIIKSPVKVQYIPKDKGVHGSRALWKENPGHEEYWKAVKAFLSKNEVKN